MVTEVERLAVLIEANTKGYENAMRRIERKTGRATNRAKRDIRGLGASLTRVQGIARGLAGGVGLGALLSAGGFLAFVGRAIEDLDRLADTADKVGVLTTELQELRFAARRVGVESGQLDTAIQRFSRRIGEAANGSGELAPILEANNFRFRDAQGTIRPLVDLLKDYADLVKNAGSEQEQLLLSFKAFDTEGAQLVNLLRNGAIGIEEFMERARELNVVIEDDSVRALAEVEKKFKDVSDVLDNRFKRAVIASFEFLQRLNSEVEDAEFQRIIDKPGFAVNQLASRRAGVDPPNVIGGGVPATPSVFPRDKPGTRTIIPGGDAEAEKAAERIEKVIEALRFEAEQVTRTSEAQRLHNELRAAGVDLASEQGQVISELVGRIQAEEARLEALEEREEAVAEAARFMKDELKTAFREAISDADSAGEAVLRLAQRLAQASLEAQLFGSGPLAAVLGGGSSSGGGVGSSNILGQLFGGFFGNGGTAPANKISVFGENGPEVGIPKVPTSVVPLRNLGGGHVTQVIDQRVNAPAVRRSEGRAPDGRTLTRLVITDPEFGRAVDARTRSGAAQPVSR